MKRIQEMRPTEQRHRQKRPRVQYSAYSPLQGMMLQEALQVDSPEAVDQIMQDLGEVIGKILLQGKPFPIPGICTICPCVHLEERIRNSQGESYTRPRRNSIKLIISKAFNRTLQKPAEPQDSVSPQEDQPKD